MVLALLTLASTHVPFISPLTPRHHRLLLRTAPPILALRGGFNPFSAYGHALATAPLKTNVLTATTLSVLADGIAQTISIYSDGQPAWNYARSRWQVVWGALVSGFAMYYWFGFLGRLFPAARTSALELAKKLFVNQLFLSPGLNGGFFFFITLTRIPPVGWMNGEKWAALKSKFASDLLTVCMRSNAFWICVQTLNFSVFPASVTVLSTNLFFVIWTVYLCIVGNRAPAKPPPPA